MIPRMVVVLSVLVTAGSTSVNTLQIRFIGNAAFELSDGVTTLVTDFPCRSGTFGYMAYDLESAAPASGAVSIVTHSHADHFDADVQAAPDVRLLTDFTPATQDFGWYVLNDNVMGGRSRGGFTPEPGGLFFAGSTNTSGGGFSSIRTRDLRLDLSAFEGLRIHVKADGRRYTWQLTTDARSRGQEVSYWADFETVRGEWRDVSIPFSRFRPTFRGSDLTGPAIDPGRIQGMGLMIYDGLDGPFELRIDRVAAYARDVRGR